jgi:Ca2+:H+ antiporter
MEMIPINETNVNELAADDAYINQLGDVQPNLLNKKRIIINIIILLVASGLVAVLSDIITNNVSNIAENAGISHEFIGIIIIAILGNAAEHWTAIYCAYINKITISITTVESSALQIMMFILPLMNFIGFSRNEPFDFVFTIRELTALIATTIIVWLTIADGKTHYLEGFALIGLYVILINVFILN